MGIVIAPCILPSPLLNLPLIVSYYASLNRQNLCGLLYHLHSLLSAESAGQEVAMIENQSWKLYLSGSWLAHCWVLLGHHLSLKSVLSMSIFLQGSVLHSAIDWIYLCHL